MIEVDPAADSGRILCHSSYTHIKEERKNKGVNSMTPCSKVPHTLYQSIFREAYLCDEGHEGVHHTQGRVKTCL